MIWLSWGLAAVTMFGIWLAGNKNPWAWRVGILNQVPWLYFDYMVGAWGLMPLAIFLTVLYYRNLRKWGYAI